MAEAKKATTKKKTTKAEEAKEAELVVETTPVETVEVTEVVEETTEEKATAKAGKRSAKAVKEAEEKEAKEERKVAAKTDEAEEKPKQAQKPSRSRLERRGKKYREAAKLIDRTKQYSLKEALDLALKTNPAKFAASVELHINLGVDPRHADQNIRGTVVLPAGSGKNVRVAVFADVDDAKKAKDAGADIVGIEEVLAKLDKENIDFDVLIATPTQMAKLGKYARLLGPKGLMPNPKSGTVTPDVAKAVKEAKAGKVEFRVDSTGIVHLSVGKTDFTVAQLLQNAQAVVAGIKAAKPASIKGSYVKTVHLTTTMGPSIPVATTEV